MLVMVNDVLKCFQIVLELVSDELFDCRLLHESCQLRSCSRLQRCSWSGLDSSNSLCSVAWAIVNVYDVLVTCCYFHPFFSRCTCYNSQGHHEVEFSPQACRVNVYDY